MAKEEKSRGFMKRKGYLVLLVLFLFFFFLFMFLPEDKHKNKNKDMSLPEFFSFTPSDPLEEQEKKILKEILGSESKSWRIYRLNDKVDVVYPSVRIDKGSLSIVISPRVASSLKFDFAIEKGLFHNKCILGDNIEEGNVILFKLSGKEVRFFPLLYNKSRKLVGNDFVDVIDYDEKGVYGLRRKLSSVASKLTAGLILGATTRMLIKMREDPAVIDTVQEHMFGQFEQLEQENKRKRKKILLVKYDELIDFIREINLDHCLNKLN
jgi:hypothetical protein